MVNKSRYKWTLLPTALLEICRFSTLFPMKTTLSLSQGFYVLICIFYSPNKFETAWSNTTEGQETNTTKSPGNPHGKVNLSPDMQQVSWQKEDDSFSLGNQSQQSPGLFWGQISSALWSLGCWSQLTVRINPEEVMIQLSWCFLS